jgi:FdhD protein
MENSKINVKKINITRIKDNKKIFMNDSIINEDILKIHINKKQYFEMVFSMTHPKALAAGFLFTQGIVTKKTDIQDIVFDKKSRQCHIILDHNAKARLKIFNKAIKIKGSSGGTLLNEKNLASYSILCDTIYITYNQVLSLIKRHQEHSGVFHKTGAVHSAALCSANEIICLYEDIGRHNALDKLAGDILLNSIDTHDKIVTLSCRMSLEIIGKIIKTGIPIVISNAAPTLGSVDLARKAGLTMIGFARDKRFNIYTHEQRIIM